MRQGDKRTRTPIPLYQTIQPTWYHSRSTMSRPTFGIVRNRMIVFQRQCFVLIYCYIKDCNYFVEHKKRNRLKVWQRTRLTKLLDSDTIRRLLFAYANTSDRHAGHFRLLWREGAVSVVKAASRTDFHRKTTLWTLTNTARNTAKSSTSRICD